MFADPRRIAVAFCAIGAFLHLYAPQAVLPMMAREYGVGAADASLIITAGTLAVAATAPFTGALSDVIGRKRLIVVAMALLLIPATMTALAPTLQPGHLLALRPRAAAAADLRGDHRLYRRRMSAERSQRRVRHLRLGVGGRRIPRPLRSRHADGLCRLARRLPGAGLRLGDLPRDGGAAADARAEVRPRHRFRHLAPADAGASAQPAAARDLRGRLRRAVQLHRHLHLSELPPRRAAVQQIAGVSRLDLRRLSVRLGGVAVARPRHRLARPAQLRALRAGASGPAACWSA